MKKTYKKKLRLRKEIKIALTILIMLISYIIYLKAQKWSINPENLTNINKCIVAWIWLIMGQTSVLTLMWEEN